MCLRHWSSEHGADRVARADFHPLHLGQPARGQRGGHQAQVGADVVGAFQHRPRLAAAGVDLGEGVQDGGGADPQAQRPGAGAHQVAGLQRRRLLQQAHQPGQLAALGAGSLGRGDLVQGIEHHRDLQGRRPRPGSGLQLWC
jgi:hypothetical protein